MRSALVEISALGVTRPDFCHQILPDHSNLPSRCVQANRPTTNTTSPQWHPRQLSGTCPLTSTNWQYLENP